MYTYTTYVCNLQQYFGVTAVIKSTVELSTEAYKDYMQRLMQILYKLQGSIHNS